MARCGCGSSCGCALTAGSNVTVTGSGTSANPWVVNSSVNCTQARACFSAGNGTTYDATTGKYSVCVSPNAGNLITRDANGCLYVASGNNTITAGCGLTGSGTVADPVTIRGKAWSFPCVQTSASTLGVYCDPATGLLHSDPPFKRSRYVVIDNQVIPGPGTTIPATPDTILQSMSITLTNTDTCRLARAEIRWDIDLDIDLPANSGGTYGISGDDLYRVTNGGTVATFTNHAQVGLIQYVSIPAGTTQVFSRDITIGQGYGGAVIRRVQQFTTAIVDSTAP